MAQRKARQRKHKTPNTTQRWKQTELPFKPVPKDLPTADQAGPQTGRLQRTQVLQPHAFTILLLLLANTLQADEDKDFETAVRLSLLEQTRIWDAATTGDSDRDPDQRPTNDKRLCIVISSDESDEGAPPKRPHRQSKPSKVKYVDESEYEDSDEEAFSRPRDVGNVGDLSIATPPRATAEPMRSSSLLWPYCPSPDCWILLSRRRMLSQMLLTHSRCYARPSPICGPSPDLSPCPSTRHPSFLYRRRTCKTFRFMLYGHAFDAEWLGYVRGEPYLHPNTYHRGLDMDRRYLLKPWDTPDAPVIVLGSYATKTTTMHPHFGSVRDITNPAITWLHLWQVLGCRSEDLHQMQGNQIWNLYRWSRQSDLSILSED